MVVVLHFSWVLEQSLSLLHVVPEPGWMTGAVRVLKVSVALTWDSMAPATALTCSAPAGVGSGQCERALALQWTGGAAGVLSLRRRAAQLSLPRTEMT